MIRKYILSILVALVILYLSLTSSHTFDKVPLFNIPFLDKIVHFLMYAGFMSAILFENRKSQNGPRHIFLIALIPLIYGVFMEILQASITATRSGSIFDALFNSLGILTAVILWIYVKPLIFKNSDAK